MTFFSSNSFRTSSRSPAGEDQHVEEEKTSVAVEEPIVLQGVEDGFPDLSSATLSPSMTISSGSFSRASVMPDIGHQNCFRCATIDARGPLAFAAIARSSHPV